MPKLKIGDREYELNSLSSLDLQILDAQKKENEKDEENKLNDYMWTFHIILYAIKKFNTDVKMDLKEFMDSFPLVGIWQKVEEIKLITGLDDENLRVGVGKK